MWKKDDYSKGAELDGTITYFDYGACLYPGGLLGDQIIGIVFEEFTDLVENIHNWNQDNDILNETSDGTEDIPHTGYIEIVGWVCSNRKGW